MSKFKLILILGIVVIFILTSSSFYGCKTSTADETTAAVTTATTVAGETTAAATTAAETSTVVAGTKRFEDYNIWYDMGGIQGDVVTTVELAGAQAAADDLGIKLTPYYSGWNPEEMIANFKTAMAQNPTGIVIIGIPGEDAFGPVIDEAFSKGIIVTLEAVDLPNIRAKYTSKGMGFAGSELYKAGSDLALQCISKFGLKSGDRAMVWGLLAQQTRGERSRGAVEALEKAGLTVDYIELANTIEQDPPSGAPTFVAYYASHPDVKLVITDGGSITATARTYLEAAGVKPGDVKVGGFDLSPATAEAIKSGYLSITFDQQFFYQAYLCVQQIAFAKAYGLGGIVSNTGAGYVDASNIDDVLALIEQGIR